MLMPCEVGVKSILPAVRRGIVRVLYYNFNMKQSEIARILEISQPSVSHFLKGIRGTAIDVLTIDPEVKRAVETFASRLVNGNLTRSEIMRGICRICTLVRRKGYMCDVHSKYDEGLKEECKLCSEVGLITETSRKT